MYSTVPKVLYQISFGNSLGKTIEGVGIWDVIYSVGI